MFHLSTAKFCALLTVVAATLTARTTADAIREIPGTPSSVVELDCTSTITAYELLTTDRKNNFLRSFSAPGHLQSITPTSSTLVEDLYKRGRGCFGCNI